jgi:hypothetical protein
MVNLLINSDGVKHYRDIFDKYHRLNGPAYISKGLKQWIYNGHYHRSNGPAVEYENGYKLWYYNGKHIICDTQEKFERLIKLSVLW